MTEVVGEAVVNIRTDDSAVGPDAKRAGVKSGEEFKTGFAGSMKGLARAVGPAIAAAGIGSFFTSAIGGASDLQETVSKTGVVFGDAAEQVLAFAKGGAEAFGQTQQQVLDAASTFGVFGKAAGLSGKELATFSNDFVGLSSDLASFHNSSPEEAVEAIGAALRGEAEPIRRFGVLLDDATLKASAMRLGLIKTTKEALTPQQKTLAAQAEIMRQTADAQGDFERTSDGLANQQRILSARFGDFRTSLGKVFLPLVTAAVKGLDGLLVAASGLGPVMRQIGDVAKTAFGPLADLIRENQAFIKPFAVALAAVAGAVGLVTLATAAFSVALNSTGIPLIIIGVAALAAGIYVLYQRSETFRNIISEVGEVITTQVLPTLQEMGQFFTGTLFPILVRIGTQIAANLRPAFEAIGNVLRDSVVPTLQVLVQKFQQLVPILLPIIQRVVTVTGHFLALAAAVLGKVIPPLVQVAGFIPRTVVPVIANLILIIVRMIAKAFELGAALINVGRKVAGFGAVLANLAKGGLKLVLNAVTFLPRQILALAPKFLSAGKSLIQAFVNGLKGAGGLVSDIAGNVWNALRSLLNNAIDKINAALEFKISLPGPDISINPPNIGHLATGTNDWRGGVAVVGEVGPELVNLPRHSQVVPNNKLGNLGMDPNALAAALVAALAAAGFNRPDVTIPITVPTDDPEAAAMRILDRLVAAGFGG